MPRVADQLVLAEATVMLGLERVLSATIRMRLAYLLTDTTLPAHSAGTL